MNRTHGLDDQKGCWAWSVRNSIWVGFACVVLLSCAMVQADNSPRQWTSADGRQMEASLIRHDIDKGQVYLRLSSNSRDVALKLEQLGEDDQAFLAELARKEGQEIIRSWTSSDGKSIRARMISHDEKAGAVRLRKADGKEFDLPVDRLSDDDRKMVEDRATVIRAARAALMEQATKVAGTRVKHPIQSVEPCSFEVYYPPSYSADKLAPMMFLFSAGGQGAALIENYKQPAEKLGWILVGCNGPKNGQELEIGSKMVADMFPEIEKVVAFHDPKKLFATGISGGATRAFQTVAQHDRPWKGVISLGGWLGRDPDSIKLPKNMAVAWVNGDQDNGANSYVGRDGSIVSKASGKSKLFPFPGGHVIGPSDVLEKAMVWVMEE
jgi:hypothetical protein